MRKRNEVFRYTPSKEMTTISVKRAALRLVDRLAHDVPQPAMKEGYMLFIDNFSHIYYAVRMANFNFLAQPIITFLPSFFATK